MPALRTMVTEIVTGLAMLGYQDVDRALQVRPGHITHVDSEVFAALEAARAARSHDREFSIAWDNGSTFARSPLGLRGRPPWTLEWKGHHRPASKAIETIPADLRVDQVYLISCKYGSRILHNSAPSSLFDHHLGPVGRRERVDWFEVVAADAYREVWAPVHAAVGIAPTTTPAATSSAQRRLVQATLDADPIDTASSAYRRFVADASEQTALRWRAGVRDASSRHHLYWRLLRMQAAPYFVLGARHDGTPMRYRVDTPWDFRADHDVVDLTVTAGTRGQPSVDWRFLVEDRRDRTVRPVDGHVEVRWSHGKLNGPPEAKVHLDTDPIDVPGYKAI